MESLNRKDIDCRLEDLCTNKRMRGISEINSSGSESSNRRMIGKSDGELEENDKGDRGRSLIKCDSFGWISVIGRRRAMEDAVAVAEFDSYRFFAVYDGHGGSGVANACRDRLHQLLEEEVEGRANGSGDGAAVEWEKVMRECFRKMDEEIGGGRGFDDQDEDGDGGGGRGREVALNTVGSTALVLIVGKAVVVVANCGDSRAVLCRDGGTVPLSRAHKPDRPDEREGVEAAGGRIMNWNGCRVLGVLATSRSIDCYLKPYVISEPEVTVWKRSDSDQFLIIASDGLWDVVSNEFACEVVGRCFDGQIRRRFPEGLGGSTAGEAAALLAELAMARGSKDNISVVVVDLKK